MSAIRKTADKLHDFLMSPKSRPDLQTPEAQAFLHHLDTHYHNEKTDALMPWLTREWKNGRVKYDAPTIDPQQWPDPHNQPTAIPGLRMDNWIAPNGLHDSRLSPGTLSHWGDFLQSNHPVRRGLGDIMQQDINSFQEKISEWNQAMEDAAHEKALQGGKIVHQHPDGWTVRKLAPEELEGEGEAMGHCVGGYGYADAVSKGQKLIYSLRDPNNSPHATVEIVPRRWQDPPYDDGRPGKVWGDDAGDPGAFSMTPIPHHGEIVQIQGKSDQVPIPEYQQRLKDWFTTFPPEERPHWQSTNPIEHIGGIVPDAETFGRYGPEYGEPDQEEQGGYGAHGDYGVQGDRPINYDEVLRSLMRPQTGYEWSQGQQGTPDPREIDALYQEALRRKEIPDLAEAYEKHHEQAQDDYQDFEEQNLDYLPHYPGEEYDEDPESWDRLAEEQGYPGQGQDEFAQARRNYDYAQQELVNMHAPTQLSQALAQKLDPHFHPQGWAMTSEGPKSSGWYNPVYNPEMPQVVGDEQIANYLNGQPPPQTTLGKVATIDPRTIPLPEWDDALREFVHNPTRYRYHHRKSEPDWGGDDRHTFDVEPIGAAATHDWTDEWNRPHRYGYDPELTEPVQIERTGEPARFQTQFELREHPEWRDDSSRDPEGNLTGFNEDIQADPAMLYRGLSHEEWEEARRRGYFQSNGTYNIGDEQGTMFSTDPGQAHSYAVGFAPWHRKPGFDAPSYVIGIPRPADAFPHPSFRPDDTNEIVVPGQVPFDQVQQAWQFRPYVLQHGDWDLRSEDWGKTWSGRPHFGPVDRYAYRSLPMAQQGVTSAAQPDESIYFHGTSRGPDDEDWTHIQPNMGGTANYSESDPGYAYATSDRKNAEWYAEQAYERQAFHWTRPVVYQVRPTGPVEEDPAYRGEYSRGNFAGDVRSKHPFEITDVHELPGDWHCEHCGSIDHETSECPDADQWDRPGVISAVSESTVKLAHPLYKRWVFSPASGKVTIADNAGDPLAVRYHTDLARELNEPNLLHGFAYRLGDGWRLTDWESKPLSDPYIIASVMRQLQASKAPSGPQDSSWSPVESDEDWGRVHHGLPT